LSIGLGRRARKALANWASALAKLGRVRNPICPVHSSSTVIGPTLPVISRHNLSAGMRQFLP
jgi:hypothetical protein